MPGQGRGQAGPVWLKLQRSVTVTAGPGVARPPWSVAAWRRSIQYSTNCKQFRISNTPRCGLEASCMEGSRPGPLYRLGR